MLKMFTTWDHAAGIGIDEPVWDSLLTFLERMAEDASEYGMMSSKMMNGRNNIVC